MVFSRFAWIFLASCLASSSAFVFAEDETAATGTVSGTSEEDAPEKAVGFGASYKFELNRGLRGAPSPTTALLGNLDLQATLGGKQLIGVPGLKAYLDVLVSHGGMPSAFNGDASYTSNIETDTSARGYDAGLYEAWVEQSIGERVSLLAGVRDLNSDFYLNTPSGGFLNSTFAVGAELSNTGDTGPSIWPKPSLGVRAKVDLGYTIYAQVAAFQASGGVGVIEAGWMPKTPSGGDSKIAAGAWTYFKQTDSLLQPVPPETAETFLTDELGSGGAAPSAAPADPVRGTAYGAYVLGDYGLTRNVSVFARVGTAQGGVSRFGWSGTAGVWASSVLGGDLGLGYFHLEHSQEYRQAQAEAGTPVLPGERGLELTYRLPLWSGATLQPDLQYVASPSGTDGAPDVLIGAVRFAMQL